MPSDDHHNSGAGGAAGDLQPADPENRALARLKGGARSIVEKECDQFLAALGKKARKGSAGGMKLLLKLAALEEDKPSTDPDHDRLRAWLLALDSEPEYVGPFGDDDLAVDGEPAEYGKPAEDRGSAQPRVVETALARAEESGSKP